MRKKIVVVIMILFLAGCAIKEKYEIVNNANSIQEISLLEYVPLIMSRSPMTLEVINDKVKITEIIHIINNAVKVSDKYNVQSFGKLDSFSYTLTFSGTEVLKLTFLYILKNQDGIFLTDYATSFIATKSEFTLYRVASGDIQKFIELLKLQ